MVNSKFNYNKSNINSSCQSDSFTGKSALLVPIQFFGNLPPDLFKREQR